MNMNKIIAHEDNTARLWCCSCEAYVDARLTDGAEVYAHRPDLYDLPFWKCDTCKNTVGCHHKTKDCTKPLGCIPTPEIKKVRMAIHALIDPLWKSKKLKRQEVYARMSEKLGWKYHTASLRTVDEAQEAYRAGAAIVAELTTQGEHQWMKS